MFIIKKYFFWILGVVDLLKIKNMYKKNCNYIKNKYNINIDHIENNNVKK
jgi:hypothetical protein